MRKNRQQSARATYKRLATLLLLPVLAIAGCSSSPSSSRVNNVTSVVIDPLYNPLVGTGEQVQITGSSYTATDTTVGGLNWSMSCTGATGTACGTLSNPTISFVTYVAPLTISVPSLTVTVTGTSVTNPSVSASYTFTVITTVFTITPVGPVTVNANQSITVTTTLYPDPGLTNTTPALSGVGCSNSTCGSVTTVPGTNGKNFIYTAPGSAIPLAVSLTLTPAADQHISQTLLINVPPNVGKLTYTPAILPPAIAGATYNQTITVSGGTPPYTVDIPTAIVPSWITSLTSTGNPTAVSVVTVTPPGSTTGTTYYQLTTNGSIVISGTAPVSSTQINKTTGTALPIVASDLLFSTFDCTGGTCGNILTPSLTNISSTNGIALDVYSTLGTSNALLNGNFVFSGLGFQDGSTIANAQRIGYIGQIHADGGGNLTGYIDINSTAGSYSVPILGNYAVYSNQTGFLTIQNAGNAPPPITFAITLGGIGADGSSSATTGTFVEYDDVGGNGVVSVKGSACCGGTRAQGPILKQIASVMNAAANPLAGSYAFAMNGRNPYALISSPTAGPCMITEEAPTPLASCGPVATAGSVTFSSTGAITTGEQDITQGLVTNAQVGVGGTGFASSGKTDAYGRATANITASTGATGLIDWPSNYIVYEVNPSTFFAMSTDPYATSTLLEGEGMKQNTVDIAAHPFSGAHNIVVYGDTVNGQNFFIYNSNAATPSQGTSLNGAATAVQQLLTPVPSGTTTGAMSGIEYVELGGATNGYISSSSTGQAAVASTGAFPFSAPATDGGAIASFTYNVDSFGRVTNNSTYYGQAPSMSPTINGNDPVDNKINVPNIYLTDTDAGLGVGIGESGAGIYVVQQQTITPGQPLSAGTYSWFNSFPNSQSAPLQAGSINIPTAVPNSATTSTNTNFTGQAYQSYYSTTYDETDGGPLLFGTSLSGTISFENGQLIGLTASQTGFQGCSGLGFVVTPTEFLCFPNSTGYTSVQVFQQ